MSNLHDPQFQGNPFVPVLKQKRINEEAKKKSEGKVGPRQQILKIADKLKQRISCSEQCK